MAEAAGQAPAPSPSDPLSAERVFLAAPVGITEDSSATRQLIPEDNIRYPHFDDGTRWLIRSDINKLRLYAIGGSFVTGGVVGAIRLTKNWYSTPPTRFHFHTFDLDWNQHEQMDKLGHLFFTYFLSHSTAKAYRWSGISAVKSIWLGALTGSLAQLQIEVADGFFVWGFSYLDLAANTIGASYATLQQLYPETLGGVRLKISYQPSEAYIQELYPPYSDSVLDDYDGMTFWLTVNIHDVLPASWQARYPKWLSPFGVAVGHGVRDSGQSVFDGTRELYLGLDVDLTKIPTGDSRALAFLKDTLNFIRLPLPTLQLSPEGVTYAFYF